MKYAMNRRALASALALAALVSCDGRTRVGEAGSDAQPTLLTVELGRLVDVYAYQRIDESVADRRLRANRRFELVARNVVVNSNLESQSLFDAAGQPVASASYEFLPFDKTVGHEDLLILWDNRPGAEQQNFDTALTLAQVGLGQVAASYRGQNTATRPIPIVPRNAALKLTFSGRITVDTDFFNANPSAIQLLEFKGDPAVVDPADAFRILSYRPIVSGNTVILDTTILGGEAAGTATSRGLPESSDNQTANIRIAIPSRGEVSPELYVKEDPITELNDVDSSGRASVIRDFRSGNLADGAAGRMREPEAPMIVAPLTMGITDVDVVNNVVTLNKRNQFVPVRGRYPFVDGPLGTDGVPRGPLAAPVQRALRQGDILTQTIQVEMSPGVFEEVLLRAEVLANLSVGTTVSQIPIGLTPNGDQGEEVTNPQLRVGSVFAGKDSAGNLHRFRANSLAEGQECVVRAIYYEENPFIGSPATLSDRAWRELFVRIEPKPPGAAVEVQTNASVAIEFTKPMDLDQVDPTSNFLLTSLPTPNETFLQQLGSPKAATARVVVARLQDVTGDGTVLQLLPPLGFFHVQNATENYRVNVRLGSNGVTDLAGNPLEVYQNPANPQDAWLVDFAIAAGAATNRVGWRVYLFNAEDEDGTPEGSIDCFGQFRIQNGRLFAASTVRFGRSADRPSLERISRIARGECWDGREFRWDGNPPPPLVAVANPAANTLIAPVAPLDQNGVAHTGNLYWDPKMNATVFPPPAVYLQVPTPVGDVIEPLKPQGSRMQQRYIEDDFSLSYRQATDFGLDVERLYWSPFNDNVVQFDVFDRVSMSLAHSQRRPDEFWFLQTEAPFVPDPPICTFSCPSVNSKLSETFAENVLEGTSLTPVFADKIYRINPNEAFRTLDTTKFVPFPRFDRTYTWRDSRLVTVDANGNVIGLGGSMAPAALPPNDDRTANVDSPWITSVPWDEGVPPVQAAVPDPQFFENGFTTYVLDPGDFRGSSARDHDPIALPLLIDIKVFPDDAVNGIASGINSFQVAMVGPPSYQTAPYGGYYDSFTSGCENALPAYPPPTWPSVRAHATGGFNLTTGAEIRIDPSNQLQAQPSILKDAGMGRPTDGLFTAPSRDGMLHWARADFVRKVSTATFGFFDTLKPQRGIDPFATSNPLEVPGFPNLLAVDSTLRVQDLVVTTDPPQVRQPAGTTVVVELRGTELIGDGITPPEPELYNPSASDDYHSRGNLLNANYACEAYRYSLPNGTPLDGSVPPRPLGGHIGNIRVDGLQVRVPATGLTRYVTEDQLGLIRDQATGLLPRYLNVRIVMNNNVDVSPALSPSLRSMGVAYRMQPSQ